MSKLFFLLALIVAFCHHVGVNAYRHEGRLERSTGPAPHRRRDLTMMTTRGANSPEETPLLRQNNSEIVAQVGSTANFRCYTETVGDEIVSWLKKDEDHLLTAGGQVYSSESKYSVSHARHLKLWELSVRDVRFSDAGLYECQLTTHPPTSTFFTLKVVEARAVIQGEPDLHVHTGVRLRLHCTVEHATEPPVYIFWFHNGSMINYTPRRRFKVMEHDFGSSLVITNVTWEDAGDFRCEPYLAIPSNVTLHVVAGEKHAALHNGQNDDVIGEEGVTGRGSSHVSGDQLLCAFFAALACSHALIWPPRRALIAFR
ncbi:zwei Ig domain protein zig-8-like [Penaeus vannamei]|uniref:zwei Ig domain protein zig-8-like n=1 Tax=Penaeus vannamei TaxID=6689 RepID=UPI00387F3B09